MAGPFASPHFKPFVSSPLGVVPKSKPWKYSVILHLSFIYHNSVNLRIPTENSQVQYDSIDRITQLVNQFGDGALMANTDIKDAFWTITIHPDVHKLLGLFGTVQMPSHRCKYLLKNIWIIKYKLAVGHDHKVSWIGHVSYAWWLFFIGPGDTTQYKLDLNKFLNICAKSGIPIKHEKIHQLSTLWKSVILNDT